jgi:hypothetical protein
MMRERLEPVGARQIAGDRVGASEQRRAIGERPGGAHRVDPRRGTAATGERSADFGIGQ